jgi:hypothetical protein
MDFPVHPSPTDRIPDFPAIQTRVEQAIVAEVPAYATWSEQERTLWRLNRDRSADATKERIRCALVAEATGQTPEAIAASRNTFLSAPDTTLADLAGPLAQEYSNAVCLALDGIGADWFYLNEHFHEGEDLSSFRTVGNWDRDNHAFQQEARARDFGAEPQPYQGGLYAEWGRCVVGNRFSYVGLYMLSSYLYGVLEEHGRDAITRLVPHRYKTNSDHGSRTAQGFIWSMSKDAGGLEDVLDALEKAMESSIADATARVAVQACADPKPKVWMVQRNGTYDPVFEENHDVVFLNPASLDAVRWTSFMADVATLAGDEGDLAALVERETTALTAKLEAIHAERMVGRVQPPPLPPSDPMFPDDED